MTMGVPHVLSHDSAAHVHELPFLSPPESLVHVTRPRVTGGRTVAGVKQAGEGRTTVSVTVDEAQAASLASRAATGKVVIVLDSRER